MNDEQKNENIIVHRLTFIVVVAKWALNLIWYRAGILTVTVARNLYFLDNLGASQKKGDLVY
jgi:hypothetical protein